MESINAKVATLKAEFQDLATNVIESDLVKALLTLATNALELVNTDFGRIITQVGLLTGIGWGATSLFGALGVFKKASTQVSLLTKLLTGATTASTLLAGAEGTATVATTGLSGAIAVLKSVAFPVIAIISALAVGGYSLFKAWQESHPTFEEASKDIKNINEQLQTNKDRLSELENVPWYDRTQEIDDEIDSIRAENEELERNRQLRMEQRASTYGTEKTDVYKGQKFYTPNITDGTIAQSVKYYDSYADAVKALVDRYGKATVAEKHLADAIKSTDDVVEMSGSVLDNYYTKKLSELSAELQSTGKLSEESLKWWNENKDGVTANADAYKYLVESGGKWRDTNQEMATALEEFNSILSQSEENARALDTAFGVTAQQAENLKNTNSRLADAIKNTNGVLSIDVEKLFSVEGQSAKTNQELANLVAQETIFNNTQLQTGDKIDALIELAKQAHATGDTLAKLSQIMSMYDTYMSGTSDTRRGVKQTMLYKYGSTDFDTVLEKIWGSVEYSPTPRGGGSGAPPSKSGASAAKQKTDEAIKVFQDYYNDLKHLRDMDKISEEQYYDKLGLLVSTYTKEATSHMKQYGLTVNQINRNMYQYEKEIYDGRKKLAADLAKTQEALAQEVAKQKRDEYEAEYNEAVNDYENEKVGLEQEKERLETAFSYLLSRAQEEIDALTKHKDEISDLYDERIRKLQEQNDKIEKQIELERLEENLARAKSKKNLVYKDGRFQYISDIDEVSSAQAELDKYKRDRVLEEEVRNIEALKDRAIKSIDEQIKYWEKYKDEWLNVVNGYKGSQDKLIAEQVLGTKLEGENWEKRIGNLQSFVNRYNSILNQINTMRPPEFQPPNLKLPELPYLGFGQHYDPNIDYSLAIKEAVEQGAPQDYIDELIAQRNAKVDEAYGGIDPNPHWAEQAFGGGGRGYDPNTDYSSAYNEAKRRGASKAELDRIVQARNEKIRDKYHGVDPNPNWRDSGSSSSSSSGGGGGGGSSSSHRGGGGGGGYNPNVDYSAAYHDAKAHGASKSELDRIEHARNEKVRDQYHGKDPNPGWKNKHAVGTTYAPGGLSVVGEKGAELRVLNRGDGIIPAEQTKNLWEWGNMKPSDFVSAIAPVQKNGDNVMPVTIQNLNLPSVKDGRDFVNYLKNNLFNQTLQLAHT